MAVIFMEDLRSKRHVAVKKVSSKAGERAVGSSREAAVRNDSHALHKKLKESMQLDEAQALMLTAPQWLPVFQQLE